MGSSSIVCNLLAHLGKVCALTASSCVTRLLDFRVWVHETGEVGVAILLLCKLHRFLLWGEPRQAGLATCSGGGPWALQCAHSWCGRVSAVGAGGHHANVGVVVETTLDVCAQPRHHLRSTLTTNRRIWHSVYLFLASDFYHACILGVSIAQDPLHCCHLDLVVLWT